MDPIAAIQRAFWCLGVLEPEPRQNELKIVGAGDMGFMQVAHNRTNWAWIKLWPTRIMKVNNACQAWRWCWNNKLERSLTCNNRFKLADWYTVKANTTMAPTKNEPTIKWVKKDCKTDIQRYYKQISASLSLSITICTYLVQNEQK